MDTISKKTPIHPLEYEKSFNYLTQTEKLYAYHYSKACWAGALVVPFEICYEAPPLVIIFLLYFKNGNFNELQNAAYDEGVSEDEYEHFMAYTAVVYANLSNYNSFGANKFIPRLPEGQFWKILSSNPQYAHKGFYAAKFDYLYPLIKKELYDMSAKYAQIGFPDKGGVTAYFSRDMTDEDHDIVERFLQQQKIDILNTRAFKQEHGYLITVASIQISSSLHRFEGHQFKMQKGEFGFILKEMNTHLEKTLHYAANENQTVMLEKYIESYLTGDIEAHKDSQRAWIKDKNPIVESNMGFIESYIDPTNKRAYYEGWVAIVDKAKSEKYQRFVALGDEVIPLFPWPKSFEKDVFLSPDFTSLDIICFGTNGCPLGINIPNYDDIRQEEGFKNVYLDNAMPQIKAQNIQFCTPEQVELLCQNHGKVYEMHVACHELMGHGVGKLFVKKADGSFNFDIENVRNPLTGEPITTWYEEHETWNGKFGSISASYEECRADTCGYWLQTFPVVYENFGFTEADRETNLFTSMLGQFRKGIVGLQLFSPEKNRWGQAHTQGAFVYAMYLYKNQQDRFIDFEIDAANNNFFIHIDRSKVLTEGCRLTKECLMYLQVYKTTGDFENGKAFYDKYSTVDPMFLEIRDIVMNNKKPRRIELNHNLFSADDEYVHVVKYEANFRGIAQSFADRYDLTAEFVNSYIAEWEKTKDYLRVE